MRSACQRRRRSGSSAEAGFTLVEVMTAASVMVVGLIGFLQVIVLSVKTSSANREADLATDAARAMIETMQADVFETLFDTYAGQPDFAVPGLNPDPADPDGFVGEIVLPTVVAGGALQLREDLEMPELGMPRDLDGNGVDAFDHSDDYEILPVLVRLQWRGATGVSRMEFKTVIAPY